MLCTVSGAIQAVKFLTNGYPLGWLSQPYPQAATLCSNLYGVSSPQLAANDCPGDAGG